MDISKLRNRVAVFTNKYKFVILILCVGMILILLPTGTKDTAQEETKAAHKEPSHISEETLAQILSRIKGAGRVQVLLSVHLSQQTQYQTDTDVSGSNTDAGRTTTVTVTDANRNESGLVSKITAPVYRGAIVVCDGAEDPSIHLAIVNAVSNITGLRSNQISVLKMD